MRTIRIAVMLLLAATIASCTKKEVASNVWSHIDEMRKNPPDTSHEPIAFQRYVESYNTGCCYIHRLPMLRHWLPVSYDLESNRVPEEVRATLFPFAPQDWLVMGPSVSFRKVEMFVCPDCETAFEAWSRHQKELNKSPETTRGK